MLARDEGNGKNRKRRLILAGLVVLLLMAGATILWLGGQSDGGQAPAPRQVPVQVTEVEVRTLQEGLRGIGTLRALAEVVISSEVAGRVESVLFEEGSPVEAGQVLVTLEDEKLRRQLAASDSVLEAARVRVANLERSFERQQRLVEQGLVSEEEFEQVRTDLDAARAEMAQLQAQVELVREQLQDTEIRAPFAGTISERLVDPGAYVSPGDPLAHLYQLDPLEISFSVPERFAGRIAEGQPVSVTTAAYPDRSFDGQVSYLSPSIDEATRTLGVKARVPNLDKQLKPGAFATALVTVGERKNPVVPSEALVATRTGYMVFVVEDGRARARDVETGLRREAEVEITEGLNPGELVVRSGHMRLDPGMPVNIVDESARPENGEASP